MAAPSLKDLIMMTERQQNAKETTAPNKKAKTPAANPLKQIDPNRLNTSGVAQPSVNFPDSPAIPGYDLGARGNSVLPEGYIEANKQVAERVAPAVSSRDLPNVGDGEGFIRRATGQSTAFSKEDLKNKAASVNVGNYFGAARGEDGSTGAGSDGDVRSYLKQKALSGTIGSRAALVALQNQDKNDAAIRAAEASSSNSSVANALAAQRLGLDFSKDRRQQVAETAEAADNQFSQLLKSSDEGDVSRGRKLANLTTELLTASNLGQQYVPQAANVAKVFSSVVDSGDSGLFGVSGPNMETLSQIKDFSVVMDGTTLEALSFRDNSGKQYEVDLNNILGIGNDATGQEAGDLLDALNTFGFKVNTVTN